MTFTKTEQRIYDALSDGGSHMKGELQLLLPDELSEGSLSKHICCIRKKIRPLGQDIITERWYDGVRYRRVRIVSTSE